MFILITGSVKIIKTESFFNFFDPPEIPEDEHDPQFDDINVRTTFFIWLKDYILSLSSVKRFSNL